MADSSTESKELPGTELFIDYCHMNWRGYAEMSRAVLKVLFEVHPELNPGSAPLPGVEDLGRLVGMPDEPVLAQIALYNSDLPPQQSAAETTQQLDHP